MELIKKIMMELVNTGERPILETQFEDINPILQFAYIYAAKKARSKTILDYGCGGGYGTEYISRFTKNNVVGFDIDRKTVEINKKYFKTVRNLSFVHTLEKTQKFDMVVTFQVIEHIKNTQMHTYLSDIKNKYLKKGGTLLVATVNKNISSYRLKKSILPFHEHEFFPEELKKMLEKYFKKVVLYGQMDTDLMKKVQKGQFNYEKMDFSFRFRIIRFVSQIGPIRFAARHTPLFVKNVITRSKEEDRKLVYKLVKEKKFIDNSYVIIFECF